jgi:hypothetical protein
MLVVALEMVQAAHKLREPAVLHKESLVLLILALEQVVMAA